MIRFGSRPSKAPTSQFFDKQGNPIDYQQVVQRLTLAEVVLFGELHDNRSIHALQLQVTRDLHASKHGDLILGAEMFEADNQIVVDEYLAGLIKHEHLLNEAKVWSNYETDYRPLLEFARENRLPFIATNIPRRYANLVAREGQGALEKLSDQARKTIAPLPIEVDLATPGYQKMLGMSMGHGMRMKPADLVAAQAVKDATMAHFIGMNSTPQRLFLHYNGDYHSRQFGGIFWYLKRRAPELQVLTIAAVESATLRFETEYAGLGDFVLLVAPG